MAAEALFYEAILIQQNKLLKSKDRCMAAFAGSYLQTEIVSAPKVYAFDTGFMCCYRGWHTLRQDDYGTLWEHYVLNELHAQTQSRKIMSRQGDTMTHPRETFIR